MIPSSLGDAPLLQPSALGVCVNLVLFTLVVIGSVLTPASAWAQAEKTLVVFGLEGGSVFDAQKSSVLSERFSDGAGRALDSAVYELVDPDEMAELAFEEEIDLYSCAQDTECQLDAARELGIDLLLNLQVVEFSKVLVVSIKLYDVSAGTVLASQDEEADEEIVLFRSLGGWAETLVAAALGPAATRPGPKGRRSNARQSRDSQRADSNKSVTSTSQRRESSELSGGEYKDSHQAQSDEQAGRPQHLRMGQVTGEIVDRSSRGIRIRFQGRIFGATEARAILYYNPPKARWLKRNMDCSADGNCSTVVSLKGVTHGKVVYYVSIKATRPDGREELWRTEEANFHIHVVRTKDVVTW